MTQPTRAVAVPGGRPAQQRAQRAPQQPQHSFATAYAQPISALAATTPMAWQYAQPQAQPVTHHKPAPESYFRASASSSSSSSTYYPHQPQPQYQPQAQSRASAERDQATAERTLRAAQVGGFDMYGIATGHDRSPERARPASGGGVAVPQHAVQQTARAAPAVGLTHPQAMYLQPQLQQQPQPRSQSQSQSQAQLQPQPERAPASTSSASSQQQPGVMYMSGYPPQMGMYPMGWQPAFAQMAMQQQQQQQLVQMPHGMYMMPARQMDSASYQQYAQMMASPFLTQQQPHGGSGMDSHSQPYGR